MTRGTTKLQRTLCTALTSSRRRHALVARLDLLQMDPAALLIARRPVSALDPTCSVTRVCTTKPFSRADGAYSNAEDSMVNANGSPL